MLIITYFKIIVNCFKIPEKSTRKKRVQLVSHLF